MREKQKRKICIIGGGLSGLTAAYYLAEAGFKVVVLEKEKMLGGLASGIKFSGWDWYLEKTVHHIFSNDKDIITLAKESKFKDIFFSSPVTGSLYTKNGKPQFYALDTPIDFLNFPLLSFPEKARSAAVLLFLKISPFFRFYEQEESLVFLEKWMGKNAVEVLWQPLFRKKFGKYAGKVLSSFFWARIKKRTKSLGYVKGGFQSFIDFLANKVKDKGGVVMTNKRVKRAEKSKSGFKVFVEGEGGDYFEKVVFAVQLPIFLSLAKKILPEKYIEEKSKIDYLHAVSLVLETDVPLVKNLYWVNVASDEFPFMGIFQHTNFVNKKHYGGKHIGYVGWYCAESDDIWKEKEENLLNYLAPYFKRIGFGGKILRSRLFKAAFTQPIFDRTFVKYKPEIKTPVKGLYFAGFELSYPYDRGTNYAVKVGKDTATLVLG